MSVPPQYQDDDSEWLVRGYEFLRLLEEFSEKWPKLGEQPIAPHDVTERSTKEVDEKLTNLDTEEPPPLVDV